MNEMTAEQKARDMLARMGVEDAQSFSAGDLVELANVIDGLLPPPMTDDELRSLIERECGPVQRMGDMLWAVEVARVVERAHGLAEDRVNQLFAQLAAENLECQRLREELAVEKKWGELWYFVSDEEPLKFEKIVTEWTPSRWIDQAYKLMAAKRGA